MRELEIGKERGDAKTSSSKILSFLSPSPHSLPVLRTRNTECMDVTQAHSELSPRRDGSEYRCCSFSLGSKSEKSIQREGEREDRKGGRRSGASARRL